MGAIVVPGIIDRESKFFRDVERVVKCAEYAVRYVNQPALQKSINVLLTLGFSHLYKMDHARMKIATETQIDMEKLLNILVQNENSDQLHRWKHFLFKKFHKFFRGLNVGKVRNVR